MSKFKVDTIRMNKMTAEQRRQFDEHAANRATGAELDRMLKDWGFKINYDSVRSWYYATHGKGKEALRTQVLIADHRGIDALGLEEYTASKLFSLVNRIILVFEQMEDESFTKNPGDLFDKLPQFIHQLRSVSSSIKETRRIQPEKETAAAVIEDCITEFLIIFKDSPMETASIQAAKAIRRKVSEKWSI